MTTPMTSVATRIAAAILCACFIAHALADRAADFRVQDLAITTNTSAIEHNDPFPDMGELMMRSQGCGPVWSALAVPEETVGVNGEVNALAVFDDGTGPALYAGGSFTTAGGVNVNRIAKWDGAAWSRLEGPSNSGVNGEVNALTVFDDGTGPALYAGGNFTQADGNAARGIAKWDGTAWSPLGSV